MIMLLTALALYYRCSIHFCFHEYFPLLVPNKTAE